MKKQPKVRTKAKAVVTPAQKHKHRANKAHDTVRSLDTLFRESPPPGSESGLYSPSKADGFSAPPYPHEVPDGSYRVKGSLWTLSFIGGRLTQAVRAEVKHLIPGEITEIPQA